MRFLFDVPNTLGTILGFKDVGQEFAITDYKHKITNHDNYIYSNELNQVGDKDTSKQIINLSGTNFYI